MTPFYRKALDLFARTQSNQIAKGLAKYPEPFTPSHWTPEELLNHALEETVDLTHYLVGLKELLDAKDKEIATLKPNLKGWKDKAFKYEMLYDRVCIEREKYKERCRDYENKLNKLEESLAIVKRVNTTKKTVKSPFKEQSLSSKGWNKTSPRKYDINFNPHFDTDDQY